MCWAGCFDFFEFSEFSELAKPIYHFFSLRKDRTIRSRGNAEDSTNLYYKIFRFYWHFWILTTYRKICILFLGEAYLDNSPTNIHIQHPTLNILLITTLSSLWVSTICLFITKYDPECLKLPIQNRNIHGVCFVWQCRKSKHARYVEAGRYRAAPQRIKWCEGVSPYD